MGKRTRRFPDRAGKTGNPEYLHRFLPFLSYHKELPIYLFLQRIFYDPGPDKICASIQKNADFSFNLTDIFQKLCYGRILEPRSKTLLQQPDSDVLQMYSTALRMFSVKTLMIYSQSFTVTHLNSEKEKQG